VESYMETVQDIDSKCEDSLRLRKLLLFVLL
jgi:hypothetical protein